MKKSIRLLLGLFLALALVATSCSSDGGDVATTTGTDVEPTTEVAQVPNDTAEAAAPTAEPASSSTDSSTSSASSSSSSSSSSALSCEDTAALFATKGSANESLADPESSAVCTGDTIVITSNGIPDYTYIGTSPGDPNAQNLMFTMPATPTAATEYADVPLIGPFGVALNGVPIYGPTEGQGGDVLSLGGALSECGSHNGPTGFHMHLFGTSQTTDCIYTADEVAAAPQLLGYAVDGYPIYTGNDQYTSSWTLTDESLFATDTWAAHSYVEGSGDLDQCNGLTDADGNYAYYTTDTFPYVIGCFAGEVDLAASGAGGGGGLGGPGGDDAEAPAGDDERAAPGGGGADFTEAAAALGVTVEELEAALGTPPPDLDAAAELLGVTIEELEAALPAPPGQ